MEVMAEIEPRLFRRESELMSAEHRDEKGKHVHHAGIAKDGAGHFCGSLIDAKLMTRINDAFPRMMRERGWEVDDMDTTDFERAKVDEAYRAERNAQRRMGRLTVNEYAMHDAQRKAVEATSRMLRAEQAALDAERAAQAAADERASALMAAQASRKSLEAMKRDFDEEMSIKERQYRAVKASQDERERDLDRREQEMMRAADERIEHERRDLQAHFLRTRAMQDERERELDMREEQLEQAEATVEGGLPVAAVVSATVEELGKLMQPTGPDNPYLKSERQPFFPQLRELWQRFTRWLGREYKTMAGVTTSPLNNLAQAVERKVKPALIKCGPITVDYQRSHERDEYELG